MLVLHGVACGLQEQQRADMGLLRILLKAAQWSNISEGSTAPVQHPLDGGAVMGKIQELGVYWSQISSAAESGELTAERQSVVRSAHREVMLWFALRQPTVHHLVEGLKQQLHSRLGLTTHLDQWPADLNHALRAQPIHRCIGHVGCTPAHAHSTHWPALEAAVEGLEAVLQFIAPEAFHTFGSTAGLMYEGPEGLHREGSWRAVDVVRLRELVDGPPPAFRCALMEQAPRTCTALAAFAETMVGEAARQVQRDLGPHPWLLEARFHLMTPGTRVMQHTATNNQRIKIHCGIRNPGNVALQIGNWSIPWQEGKCMIIDDSFEHQVVFEAGQQARVILQLKVSHPDLNTAKIIMHGVDLVHADGTATAALTRHRQLQQQKTKTKTNKKKNKNKRSRNDEL